MTNVIQIRDKYGNALYALGLFRQRTKDCDINYPLKWYMKVAYAVVGTIVYPFIK